MAGESSKPKKSRTKPAQPRKPRTKANKTRGALSHGSWGWGPDGRYTPPTDDGKPPTHLPDQFELFWMNRADEWKRLYFTLGRRVERLGAKLREFGIDPDTI